MSMLNFLPNQRITPEEALELLLNQEKSPVDHSPHADIEFSNLTGRQFKNQSDLEADQDNL